LSRHGVCCRVPRDYGSRGWGFESSWAHGTEELSSLHITVGVKVGVHFYLIRRHYRFNSLIRSPLSARRFNCLSPALPLSQAYLAIMRSHRTARSVSTNCEDNVKPLATSLPPWRRSSEALRARGRRFHLRSVQDIQSAARNYLTTKAAGDHVEDSPDRLRRRPLP
jgi:hypothetical protein